MARLLQVLLFVGLATLISGQYNWRGWNTNWDSTYNWQTPAVNPRASGVCATVFGNDEVNIVSRLSSSTYNVGSSLKLPKDGKLILNKDGTTIKFTSSASACTDANTAKFVGGLTPNQNNDFFCHRNWLVGKTPASQPPCNSEVTFNSTGTYKVWIPSNVTAVPIVSINYNGLTINTVDDISKLGPQFSGLNDPLRPGVVLMNSDARSAYCDEFQVASNLGPQCVCFTTCPDDKDAAVAASFQLTSLNKTITKSFQGYFNPASLAIDGTVLTTLINDNSTFQTIVMYFQQGLADVWGATNIQTTLTLSGQNLSLSGSVDALAAYFTVPPDNLVDRNKTVFSLTTWSSADAVGTTAKSLRLALANAIYMTQVAQKNTSVDQVKQIDPNAAFTALTGLLNTFNNPLSAFNTAFPPVQTNSLQNCSQSTATVCTNDILNRLLDDNTLVKTSGAGSLNTLASQLAAAAGSLFGSNPLLTSVTSALTAAQNANSQQGVIAVQAKTYTLVAPSFIIGQIRSVEDIDKLLNPDNLDNLQKFFYGLTKNQPRFMLKEMIQSSITFQKYSLTTSNVATPTRRRRDANFAVLLNFNYTQICSSPSPCGIPSNESNPAQYTAVRDELDTLMTFVQPGAVQTTVTLAPTTTTTTTVATTVGKGATEASSSGGGGAGLAIGAAAGGVLILILIIVALIVYSRRKRRPNAVARADDRTVVAFENPMYDDPAHGSAPVYDSAQGANDHEGLYDEPAFQQQQKKDNPLYQSTEGLDQAVYDSAGDGQADGYLDVAAQDGAGGAHDTGYLDQAPGDTGYLDQAPPVEDTGYLDQAAN